MIQVIVEMFAVVEPEGDGAAEGLETDGTAVTFLFLLNVSSLPSSLYWLCLLNSAVIFILRPNIEVCNPQHFCQIRHSGDQGWKVLICLSTHEELHQDGEGLYVDVRDDDGGGHTGTIIQQTPQCWTE